jgi:hypothetical protein
MVGAFFIWADFNLLFCLPLGMLPGHLVSTDFRYGSLRSPGADRRQAVPLKGGPP